MKYLTFGCAFCWKLTRGEVLAVEDSVDHHAMWYSTDGDQLYTDIAEDQDLNYFKRNK